MEAERLGFMGICITEHSGPWDQHEFRAFAAKHNQVLVRAMEVETNMGHILAFGLDSYQPGISDARVLRKTADSAGGFIISAHPFRGLHSTLPSRKPLLYSNESHVPTSVEEATLHPVFGLVDAVEVANGGTADAENRFAPGCGPGIGNASYRRERCPLPSRGWPLHYRLRGRGEQPGRVHERPPGGAASILPSSPPTTSRPKVPGCPFPNPFRRPEGRTRQGPGQWAGWGWPRFRRAVREGRWSLGNTPST